MAEAGLHQLRVGDDEVARSIGIPVPEVQRVVLEQVLPRIRVVPLRVGDYLHRRIAGTRRDDPSLPKDFRLEYMELRDGSICT
jgi:hypothetical protein